MAKQKRKISLARIDKLINQHIKTAYIPGRNIKRDDADAIRQEANAVIQLSKIKHGKIKMFGQKKGRRVSPMFGQVGG